MNQTIDDYGADPALMSTPGDIFTRFDAHVHMGRWRTPDFRGRTSNIDDVARILTGAGITGALLMPTDTGDNEGVLRAIAGFKGKPEFLFAAWIKPDATGLIEFLHKNAARIRALKFHPSFQRIPITDDAYRPYLEHAAERRLPVVVHCGRWQEVAGYGLALEAAGRFPGIPFILSHMGGDSPELITSTSQAVRDRHLDNVYLGTESIREYWLVSRAAELLGPDRLLFGSDHNLNHPASFLAVVEALDLPDTDRALVLGGNARRLLGY